MISDEASVHPNNEAFEDNRHDQSLLSMLTKAQVPSIDDHHFSEKCFALNSAVLDPQSWKKHPRFGIPNLVAHIGGFETLPEEMNRTGSGRGVKTVTNLRAPLLEPARKICVLDACFDMARAPEEALGVPKLLA